MVSIPNSFKKFQQTALFNIAPDTSVQNVCIDPQSQAYDALRFECGGKSIYSAVLSKHPRSKAILLLFISACHQV